MFVEDEMGILTTSTANVSEALSQKTVKQYAIATWSRHYFTLF
jgi:hypothetical protein